MWQISRVNYKNLSASVWLRPSDPVLGVWLWTPSPSPHTGALALDPRPQTPYWGSGSGPRPPIPILGLWLWTPIPQTPYWGSGSGPPSPDPVLGLWLWNRPCSPTPFAPNTHLKTAYTMTATNHDGHSDENMKNQRRTFKKLQNSRRIHSHTVFRKHVCSRHGCGRHGHCLRPSWFVAIIAEPPLKPLASPLQTAHVFVSWIQPTNSSSSGSFMTLKQRSNNKRHTEHWLAPSIHSQQSPHGSHLSIYITHKVSFDNWMKPSSRDK